MIYVGDNVVVNNNIGVFSKSVTRMVRIPILHNIDFVQLPTTLG